MWNAFFLAFGVVPIAIQLVTLPLCPESPKYTLIVKDRKERAEADLKKIRGEDDVSFFCLHKSGLFFVLQFGTSENEESVTYLL